VRRFFVDEKANNAAALASVNGAGNVK